MKESFLTKGQNVQIVISIDDLRTVITDILDEREAKQSSVKEEMLTRKEVCERLQISNPTLHRWVKEGYLKPVKVGSTKRYRESDINKLLREVSK